MRRKYAPRSPVTPEPADPLCRARRPQHADSFAWRQGKRAGSDDGEASPRMRAYRDALDTSCVTKTPAEARDYLADDIEALAEEWDGEYRAEYTALAEHLRSLADDDPVCENLQEWLTPFPTEDVRVEGTLYPDGDAMRFLVRYVPPDDPGHLHVHLLMLVDCAENDYMRWLAVMNRDGDAALWTVARGVRRSSSIRHTRKTRSRTDRAPYRANARGSESCPRRCLCACARLGAPERARVGLAFR